MQLQRKETLDAIRTKGLAVNATVAEQLSYFNDLVNLREDNEHLLLQNAKLFSRVMAQETALRDARNLNAIAGKDAAPNGRFLVARIVDRRFSPTDNVLVVNAGSNQGIVKDMAVLTPDGLVGRVTTVSDNYARVMPVINKEFKVSVVSDSTSTLGVLSWKNGNELMAHLENVPSSSHIKVGERLKTSDHSTFALRGIPVGQVVRISKGKLFSDIDVRLAVDFSSLSYVLVAKAMPSGEKLEIMNGDEGEKVPEQQRK
jgi:rod shape-determining protein MreC